MGLDDYDTFFAAKHDRGALDPVPKIAETKDIGTTSITTPMVGPEMIDKVENLYLYTMMLTHIKGSKYDPLWSHQNRRL